MSIAKVVSDFESLGVYLWTENDQLKFKAPAGVLNDAHKQQLRNYKAELIEFLVDPVIEAVRPDPENRYEPFPLTDLQVAYLVGRTNAIEYGGVGCHSYIELDLPATTDLCRLEQAWHKLIARHDMLRVTISQEGYQQVLRKVDLPRLIHHDRRCQSSSEINTRMMALRERLAHRCYQPDQWPQYEMHLSHTDAGAVLHFSIDLLIADFASIRILLAELGELYNHPKRDLTPLGVSYRDVVLARKSRHDNPKAAARYERHKAYWLERIKGMPMPAELPMASNHHKYGEVTFSRHHFALAEQQWKVLCQKATARKLTPSSVVLAAFTETLGRWARRPAFCLNLTMLNRSTAHPDIRGVVGDFIEVNVLGVTPDPAQGFANRALALQQQLWRDLEHTDFSGIDVLREMSRQRQSTVIVPVVYTSTIGLSGDELDANEFMHKAQLRYGITQTPQVWLDCQATERGGQLIVDWDIREGVFQDGVTEQAHWAFCQLLEHLAQRDELWNSNLPVFLPESMKQVRHCVNDTVAPLPVDYLHTGFCRNALINQDATAIISRDRPTSYFALARQALRIRTLFESLVNPGDRVGIVMEKSETQIAAVLGILMAEATYVPIEASQPKARRDIILEDAGVKVVLTDSDRLKANWPQPVFPIAVDKLDQFPSEASTCWELEKILAGHAKAANATANKVGYIIYTSGTTGRPKGVMVSHRAALNTVADINKRFDVNPEDKVLGLVSFGFDLSIWDIFGSLNAGATLVLPEDEKRADPSHWTNIMERHQVTLWNSVPAQMEMLVTRLEWEPDIKLEKLRIALLSGDWIPVSLPDAIRSRVPSVQVISLGGPTETSIWCVCYPVGDVSADACSIPYGTPLTNHRIHILNERLEPCPDWVTGEMYIGGGGLALGYAGDPEKTAERFIRHPRTGEHLYRSGDLGYYRPDGIIEIQGRDDSQVKILGHRIELGEVEAAICAHPAIQSSAVVAIDGVGSEVARLAAAAVPASDVSLDEEGLIEALSAHLADLLPRYMIPSVISVMLVLPLSANSKVDRKALREILTDSGRDITEFEAPLETPLEQQVGAIWRDLLKLDQISRNDDFFKIGGSSLTAINLLSAYLAEGYSVDLDLIFNNSVFRDMVTALEQANTAKVRWLESIDLQQMAETALSGLDVALPFDSQVPVKNILLTGATGYLGSYLLNRLLANSDSHIFCLLRCADPGNGIDRLVKAAGEKGLSADLDFSRLTILPGEMSKPQLGLSDGDYQQLCENVDAIIHNASVINLMDPLTALYPTNVEGVTHILALATTGKVKPVHYVSTIGVHHALPENIAQPVMESTPVEDWRTVDLTYEQSKIMAETLFGYARQRGLPVNILRPGTITWDIGQAPFINDDAFLKFYRACLTIKAYPTSTLAVNIVPVGYVADCIVAITRFATGCSENFHLVSQRSSPVETMYRWFNELGCHINPLDFDEWKDQLQDNFVLSFVNLYFRDGMEGGGHHQYSTDNLMRVIGTHNMEGFTVTKEYLKPLTQKFNNADS